MHFLGFNLKNFSEGDMRNAIINGLRQFSGILALRLRHFDGIESRLRDLSHIIGGLTVVEMRNSIKGDLSNWFYDNLIFVPREEMNLFCLRFLNKWQK